ncbi:hypothetical protein TNCV_2266911 [Trichonephila clavipes]|nr:hypothetical protein TNCV_2266911 [Trichonephila clavipes]
MQFTYSMAPFTWTKNAGKIPGRIRFVPVYTATRQNPGSKCRDIFHTLFRLGTLGVKRRVFSNSPMMHCARDSFIQDGCSFGLLALDNRINNNPHKHLGDQNELDTTVRDSEVYTSAHFQ